MKNIRMHLRDIVVESLLFDRNRDFDIENDPQGIEYSISIENEFEEETNFLIVRLRVMTLSNDENVNVPFAFKIIVCGVFEFDKKPDEKTLIQFKDINCPAIIFPYLRETIADIVRRAGFPPLHLPPVNFIEMKRELDAIEE